MVQTQKRKKLKTTCAYIPGTHMSYIFEGQHPENEAFSNQNKVIWVPGTYTIAYNKHIY